MEDKDVLLKRIQRNYRIEPAKELQEFWKEIKHKGLHENLVSFRFFKLNLLTIEEVTNFDFKNIRFWFKKKGAYFLVRYYIPIATLGGNDVFIAAYDSAKHFLGVFLCNAKSDPIFITSDLFSLLENSTPTQTKEAFLKEEVSKGVLKAFDFNKGYPDEGEEESQRLFNQELHEVLEFIQNVYGVVDYNYVLDIKTLKKSFKIFFKNNESTKWEAVKHIIEIPKSDYHNSHDWIIAILNRINFQLWTSDSDMMKEYGFYIIDHGIAMLHIHQLCEFVRQGIIPTFFNVHFPPIIYSTHPSGFVNTLKYEIKFFETQEEYDKFYKDFMNEKEQMSAREMEEKDMASVVDYFLDTSKEQLAIDGIDELKIPNEEQLIDNLQQCLDSENKKKEQFNLLFERNGKTYGHCHLERVSKNKTAYFYFFYWQKAFRQVEIIDEWIDQSLSYFFEKHSLKTIYTELIPSDTYRNEVLTRAGFEFVKEHNIVGDSLRFEQTLNLWKLDRNKLEE